MTDFNKLPNARKVKVRLRVPNAADPCSAIFISFDSTFKQTEVKTKI